MASKGKDRSLFNQKETSNQYSRDSPGALNMNYYIWAENKEGVKKKAKILDCSRLKGKEKKDSSKHREEAFFLITSTTTLSTTNKDGSVTLTQRKYDRSEKCHRSSTSTFGRLGKKNNGTMLLP